jgi:hypothetical protein
MSLKDFYYKLEDGYFKFLDNLEKKGIKVYKVIDPIEKAGIPTYPIFLVIFLGILALIIFSIFQYNPLIQSENELVLIFHNQSNEPIVNTNISFKLNNIDYNKKTSEKGEIKIKDLDFEKEYNILLDDSKFSFANEAPSLNLIENKIYNFILKEKTNSFSKKIIFKTKNNELITDVLTVSFSCSGNLDYSTSSTVVNGEVNLDDIPIDCGLLIPSISHSNYNTDNQSGLESISGVGEIYLSELEDEFGNINVSVLDFENNVGLENINIELYNTNNQRVDYSLTNSNGQFVFENVLVGNYVILLNDNSLIYSPITLEDYDLGTYPVISVIKNTTTQISFKLKKDVVGFINLQLKDKDTLDLLENVEIKLYKNSTLVSSEFTNYEGKVSFAVKENIPYKVVADHKDYVIANKTINPTTSRSGFEEFKLQRISQDSQSGVYVSVIDNNRYPIEFATIKIWNNETNTLIKTITTNVAGKAIISNLDLTTPYYLEAITGIYSGKTNPFFVKEREPLNLTIPLEIGEGTYNLQILDNTGQAISTPIKVFDVLTNEEIPQYSTTSDNDGTSLIRVRADKEVYFVINNYDSRFITKSYNVQANNILNEKIILPKTSNNSNIELIGFFDNQGNSVSSVSAGQSIKAKLILNIGNAYSRSFAHIRTGNGEECNNISNLLEQDSLYIKSVSYAGTKIVGSTSYTPCLGEAKDLANTTKRDAKWFNIIIDNPIIGSYLIEADIVVNDTAIGSLPFYYRAEFQSGNSILRFPSDSELASNISVPNKQSLYAYSKQKLLFTGASNFCNNELCYYFSVLDNSSRITKNIIDTYSAKESTNYDFSFRINFEKSLPNVAINISSIGSTINLNNYFVLNKGAESLNGNEFEAIELGNLLTGDYISGKINLDIINDSSDTFVFNILSNNEIIFTKNILFDVKKSVPLNVELVPSVFIPFIANDSILKISDDSNNPIDLANVIIKINSKTITSGKSGKSGLFAFTLPACNLGDVVEITVYKQGYKTVNTKQEINSNLLTTTPEKLDLHIDVSKKYEITDYIDLKNNTILPLSIKSISSTFDTKYINLKTSTSDILIKPTYSIDLEVKAALTNEAFNLMTQQVFNGDILVTVEESTLNKSWIVKIPATIRITFGNSVDNIDCLQIEPSEQEIRTSTKDNFDFTLNIINNCKVDNVPVSLGKLFAKVNWKSYKQLGDFYVFNKTDDEYKKVKIKEDLLVFEDLYGTENKDLEIKFVPFSNIQKGQSEPQLTFFATRANVNGIDKIESSLNTNIIINDFTSCVVYTKNIIPVQFCPLSSMMSGLYNNQYGYGINPLVYNANNFSDTTNASGILNNNSLFYNPTYPNPQYNNMMNYQNYLYSGNLDNTQSSHMDLICPKTSVPIRNNCSEDIIVTIDKDSYVTSDQEELIIEKGKSENFKLQGASQRGQFKIGLYVKPESDTVEDFTYVGDLKVQVMSSSNQIPSDCIVVTPKIFDFSEIFSAGYKTLKVTNKCLGRGWELVTVSIKDLMAQTIGEISYLDIDNVNGVAKLNPLEEDKDLENGIETWTFIIKRNSQIDKFKLELQNTNSIPQSISDLRSISDKIAGGGKTSIEYKPMLEVTCRSPNDSSIASQNIPLILRDDFKITGAVLNIDGEKVILGQKQESSSSSSTSESKPSSTQGTKTTTDAGSKTEVDKTGTRVGTDKFITGDPNSYLQRNCVDPTTQNVKGFTGKTNYESYGFNRLLFNWNKDQIDMTTCDFGNYYCDATQLYIAMNKKQKFLEDNSNNNTSKLGEIIFKKEEDGSISKLTQIKKTEFDLKEDVRKITGDNIDQYISALKSIIKSVPEELRDYTIIRVEIKEFLYKDDVENIFKDNSNLICNVYNKTSSSNKVIEFTVNQYLNVILDKISFDNTNHCLFIKELANRMTIYYGVSLNKSIIALKAYTQTLDKYNSTLNKVKDLESVGGNLKNINVTVENGILNMNDPSLYILDVEGPSNGNNNIKLNFNKKIDSIENFSTTDNYKNNILFYKPIDAYYYKYKTIPFIDVASQPRNSADKINILDEYIANNLFYANGPHNDFIKMQEGYILDLEKDEDKYTWTYANIRPFYISTVGTSFTYQLFSKNTSLLNSDNPHKWFIEDYSSGTYMPDDQSTFVQTSDKKDHIIRTVFFLSNTFKNNEEQLRFITSKLNNFNFNLELGASDITLEGDNKIYKFPNKVVLSKISEDTYKNIDNLIKGIKDDNICFEVNKNGLQLWTNPYKAGENMYKEDDSS